MNKNIEHIVYLGGFGFPVGLAEIQKIKLVSKSLIAAGARVLVICRYGVHKRKKGIEIQKSGSYGQIRYVHTSGTPFRPKSFLKRNFLKMYGVIGEIALLMKLSFKKQLDVAIISSKRFDSILLYFLLSKLLGFKTVLNFAEFNSALSREKGKKTGFNDYLFERYAFGLVDGVIPISEFLENMVKEKSPLKPCIKIPALCDFSKFNPDQKKPVEPYFLFCGLLNRELIEFILEAFDRIDGDTPYYLYLVVNGSKEGLALLQQEIAHRKKADLIKTFKELPYRELVDLYLNAKGLLIPLRPVPRDIARFPHKIGEYSASSNPIITTNVGEIVHFFEDDKNAYVAASYDIEAYSKKMEMVVKDPEKAKLIGQNGWKLGNEHFNYLRYGDKLIDFFKKL